MRSVISSVAAALVAATAFIPSSSSAAQAPVRLTGFPTLRQQHPLTCESSAASMGTRGALTETQIMAAIPRYANPNLGFRGNPDGVQGTRLADYGVYAGPVSRALARYGYKSSVLMYAGDARIKSYINRGWPVVVWVTYALQQATPRLSIHNGVPFVLVPHEHTLLVTGYDRSTLYANDPWVGKVVRYRWRDFNRAWGYFGNMGLAIQPCPAPLPVPSIATDLSGNTITWSWPAGKNAALYQVTVTKHTAKGTAVVAQGTQTVLQTQLTSARPGTLYDIAVVSVSKCGGTSAAARVWFQTPKAPTPTATPSEGTITPATSPTATLTAVAPTPTVTPAP